MKRCILTLISLSLYFLKINKCINVRKGIFNPIDDTLDLNDHQRVSPFIQTSQSTLKYKTQQQYQGIPIFGASLVFEQVNGDNDKLVNPIFGKYHNKQQLSDKISSIEPKLSSDEALQSALDALSINKDNLYGNVDINMYIYYFRHEPYLSYIIKLSYIDIDTNTFYQPMIILDANTGDIFSLHDNKKNFLDACGNGGNPRVGKVRYCGSNAFEINEVRNPVLANHLIQVYSNGNNIVSNKAQSVLIPAVTNATSNGYDIYDMPVNEGYCAACDAFEFSNFIFGIFTQYLDERPVADKHIPLKAYVHVGTEWDQSSYDDINGAINFGDGSSTNRYPLAVIDLVGHEIGHGYTAKWSGLLSTGEAGGIDNSFSDLIGEVSEYFYTGSNDWLIGHNSYKVSLGTAAAERYMMNPPNDGASIDTYADYRSSLTAYQSSGIYNKAIYLLNTQYGWSMEQLFVIFSKANQLYWTETISFNDALCGLYEALGDSYGTNLTELITLENDLKGAFNQVGLSCERNQTIATCGDNTNTYCIYKDIVPSLTQATEFTIQANLENNLGFGYGVNATVDFKVVGTACISPELSFEYEEVDFDQAYEWFDVFDIEMNLIERCGADSDCGTWNTTCISNRKLGLLAIPPDNVYTVYIKIPDDVDALCFEHDYVIRSKIKLKCNLDTPSPTSPLPTKTPITYSPTTPTIEPTAPTSDPTPFPTHVVQNCSTTDGRGNYTSRHCYFEDVYANRENQTITTVRITNQDEDRAVYYDVNYTILNNDCIEPKITLTYELIDYDLTSEYLAIYDEEGIQLGYNCNGGSTCNQWATCLPGYSIGRSRIAVGDTIKFTILESAQVDSLCRFSSGHDYSINARLDLICEGGTPGPSLSPTTKPTSEPTAPTTPEPSAAPTVPTTSPTARPTPYRQCDWNRLCYDVPVTPDAKVASAIDFPVEIQYGKSFSAFTYEINFNIAQDADKCINPEISFSYEQIDYDDPDEYLDVFDMSGTLIDRCGNETGSYACNVFDQCLTKYSLGMNAIKNNETYTVTVTKPYSIDTQCLNHSYAINAILTLTCNVGTADPTTGPTAEPSLSPTTPTTPPTLSPTYLRELCGANRYCYYPQIEPSATEATVFDISVTNSNDSAEWFFDIFFQAYEFDCVEPSITLEFERIDYNGFNEYISVIGSYNDESILYRQCGGEWWMDNSCGAMSVCSQVNGTSLGINRIKQHESYKITLIQSDGIEAECENSDLAVNAKLYLFCEGHTSSPTTDPTKEPTGAPTTPTINPTDQPTDEPTQPTSAPTKGPTHDIVDCGEPGQDRFCVYEDIYPPVGLKDAWTHDIVLTQANTGTNVSWLIYITPKEEECIQPTLSVLYEGIDYDSPGEYMNVLDIDGSLLATCGCLPNPDNPFASCIGGTATACGVYQLCAGGLQLSKQKIGVDVTYMIGLIVSDAVDDLCFTHDLAMNATLQLTCNQDQTTLPTTDPTNEPSTSPTTPTVNPTQFPSISPTIPTSEPTQSPTYNTYQCGNGNEICIEANIFPDLDVETDFEIPIQHADINNEIIFHIYYRLGGTIECALPRLAFNYEWIDYDLQTEYIDITGYMNDEQNFYQRCQEWPINDQTCDLFSDCFTSMKLGSVEKIGFSDMYQVDIVVSDEVDALCSNNYAINSVLTLTCAAGTTPPTTDPTTSQPTSPTEIPTPAPSNSPTEPTTSPTQSPTWSYLCDDPYINTWCYPLDIYPSFTDDTTWTIPIQYIDSSFSFTETYFKIIYHVSQIAKNECIEPKLTFVFEAIDYDSSFEYVNISDYTQDRNIEMCGGNVPAECGIFETCISQQRITGISQIKKDADYEILLTLSPGVDSLCTSFGNPYALNATMTLKCESGTANPSPSPTESPSDAPTTPTVAPTTAQPTRPTESPTQSPTYTRRDCRTNDGKVRYCIDIDMYPESDAMTTYNVKLIEADNGINADTVFDVAFTANGNDCVDPKVSFNFEKIDYDQIAEYINITDNNGDILTQCGDGSDLSFFDCGVFEPCLNQSSLGVVKIAKDDTYTVSVINSQEVDSLCFEHGLSLNADLTIQCFPGTATPTKQPTMEPSDAPTTPTVSPTPYPTDSPTTPTVEPTLSPTFSRTLCGTTPVTWCYEVDVYPEDTGITSTTVDIFAPDDSQETHFEINFNVGNGADCNNPALTFRYENIDLDGLNEYIEIFDDNGLYQKCGDLWECNTFSYCLKNYELSTFRNYSIKSGEIYTVNMIEQGEVDGLCTFASGHSYSLNAELTLTCSSTIPNNETNPDGTKCGVNTYCYEQIMYPSKVTPVIAEQEIKHFSDEVATQFEVTFKPINEKCYDPEVQFVYERIDFDGDNEWVKMYDNATEEIAICGAGKYKPNECGVYDVCIQGEDDYGLHLGLDYIEMSDEYKITLIESAYVDAICGNRTYSIYGFLYFICNKDLGIPSQNKTIQISGSKDGRDTVFENIVTNRDYSILEQRFDIIYKVEDYDCLNPSFTLKSRIKVNTADKQNARIYDNDFNEIGGCQSTTTTFCPSLQTCVSDYQINGTIAAGDSYQFTIYEILDVSAGQWCDDTDTTVQHLLTFTCDGEPTSAPTPEPTSLAPTSTPTMAPTGSSGGDAFEFYIINVKLNKDGTYSIIFLSSADQYVSLANAKLVSSPLFGNSDYTITSTSLTQVRGNKFCNAANAQCLKYWNLNIEYSGTCTTATPFDLSGDYIVEFDISCRSGNRNNQCVDYLNDNNVNLPSITLTTSTDYTDEICDSSLYSNPFSASFGFYTSATYTALASSTTSYSVGDSVYVQLAVSGSYVSGIGINNIFVCSSDDDLSMNSSQIINGNGGCLTFGDEGSVFNVYPSDNNNYNADISSSSSTGGVNKLRFAFNVQNPTNKDKLFIHVNTNVGLSSTGNRRRQLLQTGDATQTRSYLTSISTGVIVTDTTPTPIEDGGNVPATNKGGSGSGVIIIIVIIIVILLICIFGYWYKKRRDKNRGQVSFEPATEMGGRINSVSADGRKKGGYTVPMTTSAGTAGGYDETPINPDGEFIDQDPEIDALDDEDGGLTGGARSKKSTKYSAIETGSPKSPSAESPNETGDGDNETDVFVE